MPDWTSSPGLKKNVLMVGDDEARRARERLIDALVEQHGLRRLAADACARAGISGREQQLSYCVAVLAQKKDAARRYNLRLDADDFPERLAERADEIAGHLHDWAAVHEAIQDEFDRSEITTLRSYVQTWPGDDVIDHISDRLVDILGAGPRAEEMTIELAYEEEPAGAEYVFQSPLDAWIRKSARPDMPWQARPLDEHRLEAAGDDLLEQVEHSDAQSEEILRLLVKGVAERFEARALLADLIERADRFELEIARMRPASATHTVLLGRLRAAIADIADRLRAEQRAFRDMLAYVVLAMGGAPKLQGVTILSLRATSIERTAVETMGQLMRAMLSDERQPTPSLVLRTRAAARLGVSSRRASALERLRDAPRRRASALAPVARMLDELPPLVTDNASIAAALPEPSEPHIVAVNRSTVAKELYTVDRWLGHVFRRYAMGAA
jgi:hypothetical protein